MQRGQSLKGVEKQSCHKPQKTNKGTTTVIMSKADKIYEAKVQLDNRKHLKAPMVKSTQKKADDFISRLHRGEQIDDMTKKWP